MSQKPVTWKVIRIPLEVRAHGLIGPVKTVIKVFLISGKIPSVFGFILIT